MRKYETSCVAPPLQVSRLTVGEINFRYDKMLGQQNDLVKWLCGTYNDNQCISTGTQRHTGMRKFIYHVNLLHHLLHFGVCTIAQGGTKIGTLFVRLMTLSNIDQFSNFFTFWIRRKFVIILSLNIPPHLKYVAALPCEMSMFKATTENKTSATTHFKKLILGSNVFIVSVIV